MAKRTPPSTLRVKSQSVAKIPLGSLYRQHCQAPASTSYTHTQPVCMYVQKSRKSTFLAFKIRGRNLTGSSHYRQHHAPCGLRGSISLFSVLTIPLKKEEKDYIPSNFIHLFVCFMCQLPKERKVTILRGRKEHDVGL